MKEYILNQQDAINITLQNIRQTNSSTSVRPNAKARVNYVTEIRLPKTGGIYCYFENKKYPSKGFAYHDTVEMVNVIKKVFMGLLFGFQSFKGKTLLVLFILLFRKRVVKSFNKLVENLHISLNPHLLVPLRYATSVREIYQAFDSKSPYGEYRDIICMILEFDDAYRYRFQYALGELNKDNFNRNQYKELIRILDFLAEKENNPRLKKLWLMSKKLMFMGFFFNGFRTAISNVLFKVNPDNIKLDEADKYYAKYNHNF